MKSSFKIFRALKSRNYALFFAGHGVSLIGTWMQQIAEVWLAYQLTHSAFYLGVMGFASQIPTFIITPFAGIWIDRFDRRKLVLWGQVASMIQAFALAALIFSGHMTFSWLLVLSVIGGVIDAIEIPARQSFVIQMVEHPEDLPNAIALNSSLVNCARLLGPTLAGLLIPLIGEGWCFFGNGISYVAVVFALLVIRPTKRVLSAQRSPVTVFKEGLRYIRSSMAIYTLLLVLAVVSFSASSYSILVPIFVTQFLQGGPNTLGFLMSAGGLGALSAALFLANRSTVLGLGRVILFGLLLCGLCLVVFSFSRVFWLSWLAMLGGAIGMMSATASMNTVLQTIVDEDKRGRVMSFYAMAFIGVTPLGNLAGGTLAAHWNAPGVVRLSGIVILLCSIFYAWRLPHLRQHLSPIYRRLGILPEIARGIEQSSRPVSPGG